MAPSRLSLNAAVLCACLLITATAFAQQIAVLETAETKLELEAGVQSPRVCSLQNGIVVWRNRATKTLISTVEIAGRSLPLDWKFDPAASHADKNSVDFVYESVSPNLRLTWEWQVRSGHGPIEHQIRIENPDAVELWLPLQSSFPFDFQISQQDKLEQFYVEKGADTPSPAGIHVTVIPEGYDWEGTSSTYAQPRPGEPREIIPYFLVEHSNADQSGWYVGIEFSGRTHLTLTRNGDSLRGEVGLNPNPGPYRTRLKPGEMFETPRTFLGATAGGPDATGNLLRSWVREVLTRAAGWCSMKRSPSA
jgi:hypothetical protein